MFLRPYLGACVQQSKLYFSTKNTRSLRPSIKIAKETFQLSVDVHNYKKDEIRVKAHPDYVVIEGKQEKDTRQGYILRQFIRKFKLPDDCVNTKLQCKLSPEGYLTITAPRVVRDPSTPAEVVNIPIIDAAGSYKGEQKPEEIGPPKPKCYTNPCKGYPKVKPKK